MGNIRAGLYWELTWAEQFSGPPPSKKNNKKTGDIAKVLGQFIELLLMSLQTQLGCGRVSLKSQMNSLKYVHLLSDVACWNGSMV